MIQVIQWRIDSAQAEAGASQMFNPFVVERDQQVGGEFLKVWEAYGALLHRCGYRGDYDFGDAGPKDYSLLDETSGDRSLSLAVLRTRMALQSRSWIEQSIRFLSGLTQEYQIVVNNDFNDVKNISPHKCLTWIIIRKDLVVAEFGSKQVQELWGFKEGTFTYEIS
jgi:hypothetical protein